MKKVILTLGTIIFTVISTYSQIHVASNGYVGIGTTSPTQALTLYNDSKSLVFRSNDNYGDRGSILWQCAGGDYAFRIYTTQDPDPTHFGNVCLKFAGGIHVGSYSSLTTFLTLKDDGYIGIGKTNPSQKLDVAGYVSAYNSCLSSDVKLKKDVEPIKESINIINQLNGVSFTYSDLALKKMSQISESPDNDIIFDDNNRTHFGFVAQDLQKVLPDLVHEDNEGLLSIEYTSIIPILLEALKDQQEQIKTLNEKVDDLSISLDLANKEISEFKTLSQNKPNPVTKSTKIDFTLPENTQTAFIVVYNYEGKIVKEIEVTSSDNNVVILNNNDFEKGVYAYSLIADGKVIDTKRMVFSE